MKKLILTLPLLLALQGCSTLMPPEGPDLTSTKDKMAAAVVGAALGGYLGRELVGDDAIAKNVGLVAGTYVGMLAPAALWKKYGGQLYQETTTTRKAYQ